MDMVDSYAANEVKLSSFEESDIPDSAGVYCYRFNPFDPTALEIYSDRRLGDVKLKRAKRALSVRLNALWEITETSAVDLDFQLRNFAGRLLGESRLNSTLKSNLKRETFNDFGADEFQEFLRFSNLCSSFLPPLYIGIAVEQTLRKRHSQHKRDFINRKTGTFGGRLANFKLDWYDLSYVCMPAAGFTGLAKTADAAEQTLFAITKPLLGNR